MQVVLLLLSLVLFAYASECGVCDRSCGNWSCITNCSDPPPDDLQFDVPRCMVDGNNNGAVDSCSELLACSQVGSKLVCPVDTGDSLCVSTDFGSPYFYDTNPQDPSSGMYGVFVSATTISYPDYERALSQYSLACPQGNLQDPLTQFITSKVSLPIWACGGALYQDGFFSFSTCDYQSFDGSVWKVKGACSDPNKVWQKIGRKCYSTSYEHFINMGGSTVSFVWDLDTNQCQFRSERTWANYKVKVSCVQCESLQDLITGEGRQVCKRLKEEVYRANTLLYSLEWDLSSAMTCSSWSATQSTSFSQETLTARANTSYNGVVEERNNNQMLYGVGIDTTGRRCKPCVRSTNELISMGFRVYSEEPSTPTEPPPSEEDVSQCTPRFFSGDVRRCRSGGLFALGASCCGISGLFKSMCNREEKNLKKMREAGLCVEVGEYCSKKLKLGFARICMEKKRSYCCFKSKLARVLQECGRPQIGKGWGSEQAPDCSGFTIEEFARVDFTNPACVQAIEEWANQMAQGVEGRVRGSDIANRATDAIQRWINDTKNQKDYGGEK